MQASLGRYTASVCLLLTCTLYISEHYPPMVEAIIVLCSERKLSCKFHQVTKTLVDFLHLNFAMARL